MIRAVIFDMDGVLIDSEPYWQEAEIAVFKTVGVTLTHQESQQSMGLRIDQAVSYWYQRHPWPMPPSIDEVGAAIVDEVVRLVADQGIAMPGVHDVLTFFNIQGMRLAIASSSHLHLIEAVVRRLEIGDYFELLYSAEFEPYGKPHPGVYLTTAQKLGLPPAECLVIEDSLRGILAAKAAEMPCLAIPDPSLNGDPRLSIADWVLPSLADFDAAFWDRIRM